MPKARNSGKGYIRVSKAKKSKSKTSRGKKQRGGRVVLPKQYFNAEGAGNYSADAVNTHQGVSQGSYNGTTDSVGPDLKADPVFGQMKGGGALPAEYFGGNSGRYFAAGSPELENCTNAYGISFPSSHGVVMPGENANFMGPQLAPHPNWLDMTGGSRRRRTSRKNKKTKKQRKVRKTPVRKSKVSKKGRKGRK